MTRQVLCESTVTILTKILRKLRLLWTHLCSYIALSRIIWHDSRPNRSDPYFSSCVFSPKHRHFQENPQYSKFSKYPKVSNYPKFSKNPKLSKYLNAQLGSHGTFGHTNRPDRYSKAGTRQLKIFTNQRKSAWVPDIYKIWTNKNSSTSFRSR